MVKSQLCHINFMEIDHHEIISGVILRFLLIQEGQLSVSGKVGAQVLDKNLEDTCLPRKSMSRLNDQFDMTLTMLTGS